MSVDLDLARLKSLCDRMGRHDLWSIDDIAAARDAVPQMLDMIEHLTSGVREMTLAAGEANARAAKAEAALRDYIDCVNSGHYEAICEAEAKARALLAERGKP